MGLLRFGRLGGAVLSDENAAVIDEVRCSQDVRWTVNKDGMIGRCPVAVSGSAGAGYDAERRAVRLIRSSRLSGIFEWGLAGGEIIFFDYKDLNGPPPHFLENRSLTLPSWVSVPDAMEGLLRVELPELTQLDEAILHGGARVDHGARLSHLSMYLLERRASCVFGGW